MAHIMTMNKCLCHKLYELAKKKNNVKKYWGEKFNEIFGVLCPYSFHSILSNTFLFFLFIAF